MLAQQIGIGTCFFQDAHRSSLALLQQSQQQMFGFQLLLFVLLCQALSGHHGSPGLLCELLSGWLHHDVGRLLRFWAHRMEL